MTAITSSELPAVSRRVLHFQLLTIAWMTIEVVISLRTAWSSHSPALFAFGGDGMIVERARWQIRGRHVSFAGLAEVEGNARWAGQCAGEDGDRHALAFRPHGQ